MWIDKKIKLFYVLIITSSRLIDRTPAFRTDYGRPTQFHHSSVSSSKKLQPGKYCILATMTTSDRIQPQTQSVPLAPPPMMKSRKRLEVTTLFMPIPNGTQKKGKLSRWNA
jgi:hypothetical protein